MSIPSHGHRTMAEVLAPEEHWRHWSEEDRAQIPAQATVPDAIA